MKFRTLAFPLAALATCLAFSAGCASEAAKTDTPAHTEITPIKDQNALSELKKMSDALISAKSMSFIASDMKPIRGPNGQWIHVFATAKVEMQRPNKLFISTGGDAFQENIYYDGSTFTLAAPKEKLFTQKEMTGNIDAMLAQASETSGASFPFADVLLSDPLASWTQDLTGATFIGDSTRGKEKLRHLALMAKGVDWEVWIDARTHLPRMVYVKYTGPEHAPSVLIEYSKWEINGNTSASTFTFHAPHGAKLAKLKSPGTGGTNQ